MGSYYWRGHRESGGAVRGQLHASNRADATTQLSAAGIHHTRLIAMPEWPQSISADQITLLLRQLSTLLSAGLTLARALEGVRNSIHHRPLLQLIDAMIQELRQGVPFSQILAARPRLFDPFLIHLIRAGEQSGQLSALLARAASYREQSQKLKRQTWRALSYPLGVFLFTLLIALFLLLQVVPQFEALFLNLGGALPPLTQNLLSTTHFLQSHLTGILSATAATLLTLGTLYRFHAPTRLLSDRLILSLPLLGRTLQEVMIARFSRTLATLQAAAIPLHSSLQSTPKMTPLIPFQHAIQALHREVSRGIPLSQALQQNTLFPPIAAQMIHAGEESGQLAEMLGRLADYYQERVEQRLTQLTTLLEPLLILLIGGMVGILAVALYQPIFQIGHHF